MTDTKRLRALIKDSGLKLYYVAEQLGLTTYGLQLKIENVNEFKPSEIQALCKLLDIGAETRDALFFYASC